MRDDTKNGCVADYVNPDDHLSFVICHLRGGRGGGVWVISREKSKIKSNEILQGNTLGNKFVHLNKISYGVFAGKILQSCMSRKKNISPDVS